MKVRLNPAKRRATKLSTVQEQTSQQKHEVNSVGKLRTELEDRWDVIKRGAERTRGGNAVKSEETQRVPNCQRTSTPRFN